MEDRGERKTEHRSFARAILYLLSSILFLLSLRRLRRRAQARPVRPLARRARRRRAVDARAARAPGRQLYRPGATPRRPDAEPGGAAAVRRLDRHRGDARRAARAAPPPSRRGG